MAAVGLLQSESPAEFGAEYAAPYSMTRGDVRSRLFHPADFSLWKLEAAVEAGTEIEWGGDHGDEVLYVLTGQLEMAGQMCAEGGAIVVEAGVPAVVRAATATRLLHFGPVQQAAPAEGPLGAAHRDGRTIHAISAEAAAAMRAGPTAFFTDGSCPTCRVAFFVVDGPARVSASHIHSEDEVIHVLNGTMRVGPIRIPAGLALAVEGGRRYGYRTDGRLRFLNYRRDVSTYVREPNGEPQIETRHELERRI
jgi:hypothetical protein